MEIGSAYALQVCLLQIPAMVAFSLWYNWGKEEIQKFTFKYVLFFKKVVCHKKKTNNQLHLASCFLVGILFRLYFRSFY